MIIYCFNLFSLFKNTFLFIETQVIDTKSLWWQFPFQNLLGSALYNQWQSQEGPVPFYHEMTAWSMCGFVNFHLANKLKNGEINLKGGEPQGSGLINVYIFCQTSYAFCSPPPAGRLYPLKPGREQKAEDVRRKMFSRRYSAEDVRRKTYMLICPDPSHRFKNVIVLAFLMCIFIAFIKVTFNIKYYLLVKVILSGYTLLNLS